MKFRITYKEIAVALGILVALIAILTLSTARDTEQASEQAASVPVISVPKISKTLIGSTVNIVF